MTSPLWGTFRDHHDNLPAPNYRPVQKDPPVCSSRWTRPLNTMISLISSTLWVLLLSAPFAFAQIPSDPGCNKRIPPDADIGNDKNVTIKSGNLNRTYLLHVPETYDGKSSVPLILSFHGRGKDAKYQKKLSEFSNDSFNPNAISVYPQGVMVSYLHSLTFHLDKCWDDT